MPDCTVPLSSESGAVAEIVNIASRDRTWPGDTLMGSTARECVRRGWATVDADGYYVATDEGRRVAGVPRG